MSRNLTWKQKSRTQQQPLRQAFFSLIDDAARVLFNSRTCSMSVLEAIEM